MPASPTPLEPARLPGLLDRVSGAPLLPDHELVLLRDSAEHEAATLALIASARHHIYLENYCLSTDAWGETLLAALQERARAGVRVCVLHDWLGSWRSLDRSWVHRLREAGGELHSFNPLTAGEPLGWLFRDHRKLLTVDGLRGMITGWCQSARWRGRPGEEAWRDTGVWLQGSGIAVAESAFAETWRLAGGLALISMDSPALPASPPDFACARTRAAVRVLVGRPQQQRLYHLDQLIIGLARDTLWLTDAYPVGTAAYLDSLAQAARAGVDVRLLVPGSTDLPLLGMLARSGYRALLDAGIRIYEWNGPMLHAKTAVVDGCWARVGSSNLNPASWLGNYEMDLVVEDAAFGQQMAQQFLADLERATEIVLDAGNRVRLTQPRQRRRRDGRAPRSSATTLRVSRAMAQAVRGERRLGPVDATLLAGTGGVGVLLSLLALWRPAWIAWPLAVLGLWISSGLLRIAWRRYRAHRAAREA